MNMGVNTKRFRQELGMAIRRRRHKLNLSQEDFADKANIHRTYVSSIELGKVDVGIGVVYKIAVALDIPLNKLLKETENNLKN
ncbi:MAG: helix-turn-helix transcriptional regulator [Candidatus Omnitrophica bacterium]|nr:helix-turn-helix transcriptional regulator [Candidatus Omnitrophota bacterium]